jgi:uncharacterized CHY-type Zn-finger protein
MGLILCQRHGSSGIAHVCSHISPAVEVYSPVTEFEVWEYYIDEDIRMPHWFCPQCVKALRDKGLPDSGFSCESEESDAMLERIFEQFGDANHPVCGSCLMECIARGRDETHGE